MTTKDWIILCTPILLNGIIIFVFQKILSEKLNQKIDKINKRQDIRDDVVKRFWNKLQDFNDTFIKANNEVMQNPEKLNDNLKALKECLVELIKYYDTNEYDLKQFSDKFQEVNNKWNCFGALLEQYKHSTLTSERRLELGSKLQEVKEANQKLIAEVRKNY